MPFIPDRPESGPRRLGDSIDAAVGHLRGSSDTRPLGVLFARWSDIVGDLVAAHARPVALRDGKLLVDVDDNAWAVNVRYLGAELQARIDEAIGPGIVAELAVRVRPPGGPRPG